MGNQKPWPEDLNRDMGREELLEYLDDDQIKATDYELATAIAHDPTHPGYGTQAHYVGGVLWWVIYWYGSESEQTRLEYKATDSLQRIILGGVV
jgi:hypothetical protein